MKEGIRMFFLELTYQKPITEVNRYLDLHNQYLEKYYQSGNFICSGRKNPRTGGVILCQFDSLDEVQTIIQKDPFLVHSIANYQITEFIPTKAANQYKDFLR